LAFGSQTPLPFPPPLLLVGQEPKSPAEKPELVRVHESIKDIVAKLLLDSTDIVLEEQEPPNPPMVKAASQKRLIERLSFVYPDPDFTATFFMTYYRFMTGRELVGLLFERFDFAYPNLSTQQYFYFKQQVVTPVHLRSPHYFPCLFCFFFSSDTCAFVDDQ